MEHSPNTTEADLELFRNQHGEWTSMSIHLGGCIPYNLPRTVGIEYLDKLELYKDDVRNLSRERYGEFDLVICSGILYHLDGKDVFPFIRRIYEVCTRVATVDTASTRRGL